MRRPAQLADRAFRWRSTRAALTVLAAFVCITRGLAYLPLAGPERLPLGLQFLADTFGTITPYGWVWMGSGLALLTAAALGRIWLPAWGVAAGISFAWTAAYAASWVADLLAHEPSRAWLNAATYAALTGVIVVGMFARPWRRVRAAA